jgi:hypothetical protein
MVKLQLRGAICVLALTLIPAAVASQAAPTVRMTSGGASCRMGFQGVRHGDCREFLAEVVSIHGSDIMLVRSPGDEIPETDGMVAYDWLMIVDLSMGFVWTEPSGWKYSGGKGLLDLDRTIRFDADIDLEAIESARAVRIRSVNFDVWGERPWIAEWTEFLSVDPGERLSFDVSVVGCPSYPPHEHYRSISWVSDVMTPDGTIKRADIAVIIEALTPFWASVTEDDLLPSFSVSAETLNWC